MQIMITGRNFEVTDGLREYIEKKLNNLNKYIDVNMETRAILGLDGKWHIAEMIVDVEGTIIKSQEKSHNMRSAVDRAFRKLKEQVRKHKERLVERSRQRIEKVDKGTATGSVLRGLQIIKTNKFAIKPMTPEEAALELELLKQEFFVFSNSQTDEVNVIYKRKDGNYGLIEPEF